MFSAKPDKRTRLVAAATKLAYRRGFGKTSLADIAKDAKVPLGNVYYYFKTKEEIGAAIVEQRLDELSALLQELDKAKAPEDRLCGFVQMALDNRNTVARGGCPIGTFCSEVHKERGALSKKAAAIFAQLLTWLQSQFEALGKGTESQGCAVNLISALQGVAVLAQNFNDPRMVEMEAKHLKEWIRTLAVEDHKGGKP